ncbi:TSUP family transporter [Campylobacter fetus]|uniref:TSUP family transporter n=1 Tax=Campylobacter fetus TaxID=196 RepID=UPI000818B285|nr:TSUP family transporter [Campylobacter fetus]EAH8299536.1 hypothetical protein [Campylobacter fetus]EAI7232133.1 hypothetical protein [Campylobacter fetus]EAJ5690659.1 hypothetical protein [Campylobacter fetus]EAK0427640.1 hypothetical protein [Campylobacter fetus]EAK5304589.1 hypothetical protein [Campylobacter fetus]
MEFELWHYALLFFVACFSGFVDAIAGGGGLITIPILISVGIPEYIALATNKLQSSFGSFTATLNFSLKGYINYKDIWIGVVFTFIGAVLGTICVLVIDPKILSYLIPIFLILIFLYTIFSPKIGEKDRAAKLSPKVFYITFGLMLGFYDGFFGPGAGSFWMFAMVALLGIHMKKAVAHTKALNFTSNIVSLGVFIAGGQILWMLGIIMGFGQIIGAYFGSKMVIKKEVKFIKIVFLVVVACTILKLIYDLFVKQLLT